MYRASVNFVLTSFHEVIKNGRTSILLSLSDEVEEIEKDSDKYPYDFRKRKKTFTVTLMNEDWGFVIVQTKLYIG